MDPKVIKPMALKMLATNGAVEDTLIRFDEEGRGIVSIRSVGGNELLLGTTRGSYARLFETLEGAVSVLQDCGINETRLDSTGFVSRGKKSVSEKKESSKKKTQSKVGAKHGRQREIAL